MLPGDGAADLTRLQAARTYCLVALGCPPRSGGVRPGGLNTKDILRMLAASLRCDITEKPGGSHLVPARAQPYRLPCVDILEKGVDVHDPGRAARRSRARLCSA